MFVEKPLSLCILTYRVMQIFRNYGNYLGGYGYGMTNIVIPEMCARI